MKKRLSISICAAFLAAAGLEGAVSEEELLKRINNHFLVQDVDSARQESSEGIAAYPQSRQLFEVYIKAAARAGDERESLAAWNRYIQMFHPDEEAQNRVIEELAWGTINKTAASQAPPLRLMGILAAFLSQDARGIKVIRQGMRDPNILIRAATVKLTGNLHDAVLQDEVEHLIATEKAWKVRLEAIKSAGEMKLKRVKPALVATAGNHACHAQERAAAITALVQMQKAISREELANLVQSNRAGMRILACEIVAHLELKDDVDLLMPLLGDYCADVRAKALYTVGLLRVKIDAENGYVVKLLDDPDTTVAIVAAWAVALSNPERGQKALEKFFTDTDESVRRLAAGALVAAGRYGFPLTEKMFYGSQDPYVRLNLAVGLIGQRRQTREAADVIYQSLSTIKEQLMENDEGFFTHIVPSTIKHDDLIPNAPEAVNQKTRLELLNILAVVKYPKAQDAIKQFLQEKKWGITGMASAVLLTEGDDEAIDLVKQLLKDPAPPVRLQAALVLALWGGSEDSLAVLEASYAGADFEEKEKIIEGIGRVGSKKSIPFLIERLQEPHQTLRLIAAAGLVQTLYN